MKIDESEKIYGFFFRKIFGGSSLPGGIQILNFFYVGSIVWSDAYQAVKRLTLCNN